MCSVTGFRYSSNWLMIIFALASVSLLLGLGIWQLQRADEKTKMLVSQKLLAEQSPVLWDPKHEFPMQYQKLILNGHYGDPLFLFDNQHYQHQFGYDVISPFFLKDGSVVMIDRGWVLGDPGRTIFPTIFTPQGLGLLQGSVYFPSKNRWILGPNIEKKAKKLMILEQLNIKNISHVLQKKVYPFIIRLDKEDYGFVREWAVVSMPPQRHIAYALQWFAMALVLVIALLALNWKKER